MKNFWLTRKIGKIYSILPITTIVAYSYMNGNYHCKGTICLPNKVGLKIGDWIEYFDHHDWFILGEITPTAEEIKLWKSFHTGEI